ncbi:hypothetical protein [Halopiger djelfimassiliensis]|uniref:hypothetical protein n=1 Tax=Halopiger djelfimassiliensis TaxID=1293047 RepID=UPI000677DE69|nr:hypothetical protein [Halopiger djelfimassiliensis]
MTDSTIGSESGEGGVDVGSSVDELFDELAEESPRGEAIDREAQCERDDGRTESSETPSDADDIEDQTAAAVFGQLKDDVDDTATDELLSEDSPEDIIASADEPDPEHESPVDDDLLVDEDELEELLLTGRRKEQEFLWIDPDDSTATDSDGEAESESFERDTAGSDREQAATETERDEPAGTETDDRATVELEDETEPEDDEPQVKLVADTTETDDGEETGAEPQIEDEADPDSLGGTPGVEPDAADVESGASNASDGSSPRSDDPASSETDSGPDGDAESAAERADSSAGVPLSGETGPIGGAADADVFEAIAADSADKSRADGPADEESSADDGRTDGRAPETIDTAATPDNDGPIDDSDDPDGVVGRLRSKLTGLF